MPEVLEQYNLVLESVPESVNAVEGLVESVKNDLGFSDAYFGNMMIVLTEAVANAIFHGNKSDTSKKVHVSVSQEGNEVWFIIKDEGNGFDHTAIPDPTAPENLEKPSGRGIFLMTQLADMVIFSDKGSTTEICFKK